MNFFSDSIQDEKNVLNPKQEQAKGGILGSIKNVFSAKVEEPQPLTCKDKLLNTIEVEKSYTAFFIMLAIGGFVLFLSLIALPTAILFPKKFVMLFSMGSLLVIMSFIFVHGTKEYFKMLFNSGRAYLTTLYFLSIFVGIYFSFTDSYFFISHICAVIQLITLVTFVLSFVPGGNHGINFIWSSIKSIFVKSS